MGEQIQLFPEGLSPSLFERLSRFAEQASSLSSEHLRKSAEQHLDETRAAHVTNRLVNLRLAVAIVESIRKVLGQWSELPATARYWLAGAVLYFTSCHDDEPDFNSPIGFEDDAEVLNACLGLANLSELRVNPEDYDNV